MIAGRAKVSRAAPGRRRGLRFALGAAALVLAGGCDGGDGTAPAATGAASPAVPAPAPARAVAEVEGATPLGERVATLGLLNKRNNLTQDITLRPGESRRIDDIVIRLASCERTAPWESPAETGAFVQVFVQDRGAGQRGNVPFRKVFSGWLFLNSPSLNVVEHPVYDVWVKDCAMSFPGEGGEGGDAAEDATAAAESSEA